MISVTTSSIQRLLVVGDNYGVPELLARVPSERVVGIIAAEIRPQYHDELKSLADAIGAPFLVQPRAESSSYIYFLSDLSKLYPDSLICHSYSMLLRNDVLTLVGGRAFNVHMALLPRNRGPNPIQWALIHGDQQTGVSLHVMDVGFDSGSLVDHESVDILEMDTWITLLSRVKVATNRLLDRTMPLLLNGKWQATPQAEHFALHNARIPTESLAINFATMRDLQIYNLIRAQLAPLKGAYLDTPCGRVRFTKFTTLEIIAEMRRRYSY